MNKILVCWLVLAVIIAACPGAEGRRQYRNCCRYCESQGKECYWMGGQCRCRNIYQYLAHLPPDPRLKGTSGGYYSIK
ncbi:hypothetical protein DPMN_027316 [Dreissena polymorpha]|uniref:Uncharacterized protein n=1 Tax=Dreissena polymorpha TaxID=45954 RepID=A0A9D4RFD7_DREPO|nr:hypothetical protein DPMN_027316 [Dreissena polymorpha]